MTQNDKAKVLAHGASGMRGGVAVRALRRAGHPVTAFVREPSSAAAQALTAQGADLATGTFDDLASLAAASAGNDAVFSMQMPGVDPADPGTEARHAGNIVAAVQRAGVAPIIHTSPTQAVTTPDGRSRRRLHHRCRRLGSVRTRHRHRNDRGRRARAHATVLVGIACGALAG